VKELKSHHEDTDRRFELMLEEMKQLRQDVNRQIEVIFASLIQRYEGTYRYCVPLFREWLLEDDVNALLEH